MVGKRLSLCVLGLNFRNFHAMGYFKPITALYLPPYIKPRQFAKRQREWLRQSLTPPQIAPEEGAWRVLKRTDDNRPTVNSTLLAEGNLALRPYAFLISW